MGFIFLDIMQDALNVNGMMIPNTDFIEKFKNYQYIRSGLNYRIACDNPECQGSTELVILNRGFGQFDLSDRIVCPICLNFLNNPESIKNLIFFDAKVCVHIGLTDGYKEEKHLSVLGNQLLLFCDNTKREMYSNLRIDVKEENVLEHESYCAVISNELLSTLSNGGLLLFDNAPSAFFTKF